MIRAPRRRSGGTPVLEVAPLVDLMFTLLIFFLVTSTFSRNEGVEVNAPSSRSARAVSRDVVRVILDGDGSVFVDGRRVDLAALTSVVRRELARSRTKDVVLVVDGSTKADSIVRAMDEARAAGAIKIALGASREGGRER